MDKIKLLKPLRLFSSVPEKDLQELADFLTLETHADGARIFQEDSQGDSLYFVASGRVRISKKLPESGGSQDLADLGPGDCFGEMAVIEAVRRSADAYARGETLLLRLRREDLDRWLKKNPLLALGFFTRLVQTLSARLRRSTTELTLLYDLSRLLVERCTDPQELLGRVLGLLHSHLEGDWISAAWIYNKFNDELDLTASQGDLTALAQETLKAPQEGREGWLDERTCVILCPGERNPSGAFLFRRHAPLPEDERVELRRTLLTIALLIATAVDNISLRAEEDFRSRLNAAKAAGPGL
ncbi:MAG: cyclic nucleotide-binding domain-containing protein [Elusimicrobiota bacterium]|jgi:CRP-like cAMP-binding protein